uniref:Helicase ATP-binding domain-containing protein n=1 Tax=viral metagenome TaxID=1070528 RepID=A0A6C0E8E8_9ZZZZ
MNYLEELKNKPSTKDIQREIVRVNVGMEDVDDNKPSKNVSVKTPANIPMITEEIDVNYDRNALKQKIVANKLSKITAKTNVPTTIVIEPKVVDATEITEKKAPLPAKLKKKILLEIEEDKKELETIREIREKIMGSDEDDISEIAPEVEKTMKTNKPGKSGKSDKSGTIIMLEPHEYVEIGKVKTFERLGNNVKSGESDQLVHKVSSYYLNNREIFVNFINSIFERYTQDLAKEESTNTISCDNIGTGSGSGTFSLLTHQKLVRDYLNLYTPYRGLLLYHGLGSGKTASSIAIAEGMKTVKKILVLTPASLRDNYMEELKKAGDFLYKRNQYWEWISVEKNPEYLETLSSILHLPVEYIKKKKGAWLVNVSKPSNYTEIAENYAKKKSLEDQIDEMIHVKYSFINYNGLRTPKLKELTNNFTRNIFDDKVIIIDEAHNFISRIVNKLGKEKDVPLDKHGNKEHLPRAMFLKLYEMLLSARNARVVLLTGTPIVNYPNEIAILFNILRGYIKTWEIPIQVDSGSGAGAGADNKSKLDVVFFRDLFSREKLLDYLDYSSIKKTLYVTRNPFGFHNKYTRPNKYIGVSDERNASEKATSTEEVTVGSAVIFKDSMSDEDFEKRILHVLQRAGVEAKKNSIYIKNYTALPDKLDKFLARFIDSKTNELQNVELFKRRIIGLTSYFRSAQEELLPKYEKTDMYHHVVKVPMSDYQFHIYENERKEERKMEKTAKSKKKGQGDGGVGVGVDMNELYNQGGANAKSVSTYRIFSRFICNFVVPIPGGRPKPKMFSKTSEEEGKDDVVGKVLGEIVAKEVEDAVDADMGVVEGEEGVIEGDDILNAVGDNDYKRRLSDSLRELRTRASEFLTPEALKSYSPKYLAILDNIIKPEHPGLHLVYSQFRSYEGIEVFSMVLEQNGFARFKIKRNSVNGWVLDIDEDDWGKPMYALYTGTEDKMEREIIRKIYNGAWNEIPQNIAGELREISNNNNMGEIIKVFMITSSGSEGINLTNTRYVHIMDPYWHPVRIEQVIGRARRICSHKNLSEALQTVEVFIYLMTFTKKQIESDDSIELNLKDVSKLIRNRPITSDEYLYEIASIKEKLNQQLIHAIKETAIDCVVYSKKSKENLHCLSFGEPNNKTASYHPSIDEDPTDRMTSINKQKVEWSGVDVTIQGVKYISRKINSKIFNIYDYDSYMTAVSSGRGEPRMVGTLEINEKGQKSFKTLVV